MGLRGLRGLKRLRGLKALNSIFVKIVKSPDRNFTQACNPCPPHINGETASENFFAGIS